MGSEPKTRQKKSDKQQTKKPKPQPKETQTTQRTPSPNHTTPFLLRQAVQNPEEASPEAIQAAQRAYGNQFVQRLAGRDGRSSQRPTNSVQRALKVSDPEDQYEQEAEKVADTVSRATQKTAPGGDGDGNGGDPTRPDRAEADKGPGAPGEKKGKEETGSTVAARQKAGTKSEGNVGGGKRPFLQSTTPTQPSVQRALKVSDPEDKYEKEAESVADTVARAPEHTPPLGTDDGDASSSSSGDAAPSQSAAEAPGTATPTADVSAATAALPSVPTQLRGAALERATAVANTAQRQATEPEELPAEEIEEGMPPRAGAEHAPPVGEMDDEGETTAQRAGAGYDAEHNVNADVENQIKRRQGGGESLPPPVQQKMEGQLGHDFSGVRVHHDQESDRLNRSLDAKAFTTGSDIFFQEGAYEPGSKDGQKLLAHELTHVVQQGAAAPAVGRQEAEEKDEDNAGAADVQRAEGDEQNAGDSAADGPTLSQLITPLAQRQTIQRADDDEEARKAKEKGRKKLREGEEKANKKKGEKESEKEESKNKAGKKKEKKNEKKKKGKQKGEPKPKAKQPRQVEAKEKVGMADVEPPEVETGDTGSLGWPVTKTESVPDWDDEITKYDAFKSGNFEALGADFSGLEGDTTGLSEPITVDDPEVRRQMVADALAGGIGGDGDMVSPMNQGLATITDSIPFAAPLMSMSKFATEGPEAWWEGTKAGFENAAANISSAWKGMGEGSGWNRAASAIEFIIGLLEMLANIYTFLLIVLAVVLVVLIIIFTVGSILAAIPFTSAVGTPMVSFSSPLIPIVALLIPAVALNMVYVNLFIRLLREVAIAFRVIDMLYFESDPDKLMERQAKLAEHVSGLNQGAQERITPGINKDEEAQEEADQMLVGAEELDEPLVSNFSLERVNTKSAEEKQDYKTAWMKKYGVRSTADDVREELVASEAPPPPLAVYTGERENDVAQRIDRNAIAIVELKKQRLGLSAQSKKTGKSLDVAQNQKEIIGGARETVAENKKVAGEHQKDIETKLEKQDELKGKTTETEKKGQQGGGQGAQVQGLAGLIIKMLQPLMPAMQKAGEKSDPEQKKKMKDSPSQALSGTDSTVDSAKMGSKEADKRKEDTKKTQKEAQGSQKELDETDQYLAGEQEKVEEGIDQLQEKKDEIDATNETLAQEEQRLIEERTTAINDAVNWMAEWRERRAELFEQMESRLEERLPKPEEEEKEDEKIEGEDAFGDEKEEKDIWDIYDKKEDQGKTKGAYFAEGMTAESEEGADEDMEFSLG